MNRPESISHRLQKPTADWSMRLLEYGMCALALAGALLLGVAR